MDPADIVERLEVASSEATAYMEHVGEWFVAGAFEREMDRCIRAVRRVAGREKQRLTEGPE